MSDNAPVTILASILLLATAALILTYTLSSSPQSTMVALEMPQLFPPVMR